MVHGPFRVRDSDIYDIEPLDLWPLDIDPAFRDQTPVGLTEDASEESKGRILWDDCAPYYGLRS